MAWGPDDNIQLICKACMELPANLVADLSTGHLLCGSCRQILGYPNVDTQSESGTHCNDDLPCGGDGAGTNPFLDGSQLGTSVSSPAAGADGGAKQDLKRAKSKAMAEKHQKMTLLAAYNKIDVYCNSMGLLKNVSDSAKQVFKRVSDNKLLRGKSHEKIIAGGLFIACRREGVPRTFREIFEVTKVPAREIGRLFKQLEKIFNEQQLAEEEEARAKGDEQAVESAAQYKTTPPTKACDLMIRYCSKLHLSEDCTMIAQELSSNPDFLGALAGRSASSGAAACIFLVSHLMKQPKSAKEIGQVAGLSDCMLPSYSLHPQSGSSPGH